MEQYIILKQKKYVNPYFRNKINQYMVKLQNDPGDWCHKYVARTIYKLFIGEIGIHDKIIFKDGNNTNFAATNLAKVKIEVPIKVNFSEPEDKTKNWKSIPGYENYLISDHGDVH